VEPPDQRTQVLLCRALRIGEGVELRHRTGRRTDASDMANRKPLPDTPAFNALIVFHLVEGVSAIL
jgi:hypothetical protein